MKVRDVLARIGDEPLKEALKERGYAVYPTASDSAYEFELAAELESRSYLVFGEDEEHKMVPHLRAQGYAVMEPGEVNVERGFELYRNGKREEFRQWLRDLFWDLFGRIV